MDLFSIVGKFAINGADTAKEAVESVSKSAGGVAEKLQTVGGKVAGVGMAITKGMVAGVTAMAGAGMAVAAFAGKAASAGDHVDKMSQKIGISRTAYQELDFACSQSGTSVDSLQMGLKTMTNLMQSASDGNKTAAGTFEKLGLSIYDSSGQLKSQETMMWEVMSALQGVENQTEKAALATDLFGRSGSELMPMLNGAEGSIDAMRQQAHDLGLVMGDDAVNAAVAYTDTMDQLKRALGMVGTEVGIALMPYLQQFAQWVIRHMPQIREAVGKVVDGFSNLIGKVGEVIAWFNGLSPTTQKLIGVLAGVAAAIGPVLVVAGKAMVIAGNIPMALDKIKLALGGISAPVVAVAAVIAVLTAAFIHLWNTNEGFRNAVIGIWNGVKESFSQFASGIVERLNALGFNFESITDVIKGVWNGLCNILAPVFINAFTVVSTFLSTAFNVILSVLDIFTGIFTGNWSQVWDGIKGVFSAVWDGVTGIFSSVLNAILGIADVVLGWFGSSWSAAWTAITGFFTGLWSGITGFFSGVWTGICNVVQFGIMLIGSIISAAWSIITLPFMFIWENCKDVLIAAWEAIKSAVSTAIDAVSGVISSVMGVVSAAWSAAWNAIKSVIAPVWAAIKSAVSSAVSAVSSAISSAWNAIESVTSSVWNGIKSAISSVVSGIKSAVSSGFSAVQATAAAIWNGIKNAITTPIEAAKAKVSSAISAIKGFFSGLNLQLPHIKLPHFSVSGTLSITPPSVPKLAIDWYAKAMDEPMMFTEPTLFSYNPLTGAAKGAGEAGDEVMIGKGTMLTMIQQAVSAENAAMAQKLQRIIDLLVQFFPDALAAMNQQMVLDSGVLVAQTAPAMNVELGKIAIKKGRGR